MNRALTALAVSTLLVGATATPANAITAKSRLVGPDANLTCGKDVAEDGESINERGPGNVTLKTKRGKVIAAVELKKALPRTDYVLRLIQTLEDCHTVDGVIRTDRRGNGKLKHTERITGLVAVVHIDTGALHAEPHWRSEPLTY
jgi:hypothetical protein